MKPLLAALALAFAIMSLAPASAVDALSSGNPASMWDRGSRDSRLVVYDLLDAFEPEECEAVAAFFGAVVNPKDAILRLEADGDFGQELLADAQSCGGAGQGEYVGYGDHGGARLAGA
jgi:hypothetical protein